MPMVTKNHDSGIISVSVLCVSGQLCMHGHANIDFMISLLATRLAWILLPDRVIVGGNTKKFDALSECLLIFCKVRSSLQFNKTQMSSYLFSRMFSSSHKHLKM